MKSCASDPALPLSIGERLREERIRLGLKQEDFAVAGGVNRNTQGSYEKGARNPDTSYLAGIEALGADLVYVISGRRVVSDGLSSVEAQIIEQYRSIPDDDQRSIRRIVKAMFDDLQHTT